MLQDYSWLITHRFAPILEPRSGGKIVPQQLLVIHFQDFRLSPKLLLGFSLRTPNYANARVVEFLTNPQAADRTHKTLKSTERLPVIERQLVPFGETLPFGGKRR